MKYSDHQIWHKVNDLQQLHWIHLKQISSMNLFYADHFGFYLKGEYVCKKQVDMKIYEEKINYFKTTRRVDDQGIITEICSFKQKEIIAQFWKNYYEINKSNHVITKQFLSGYCQEQIVHIQYTKNQMFIVVYFHVGKKCDKFTLKFLQELIVNYSSVEYLEYFDPINLDTENQSVNDKYVCNYNDSIDFVSEEIDYKYFDDHDRIHSLDQEDLEVYSELSSKMREYKLSTNTLIRFLIGRGFDLQETIKCIMNWIEWRRTNKINWLSAKQYPEFKIFEIVGESRCGRQVVYTKQSLLKPDKINHDRYAQYFIGFLEDVCRTCKGKVDSYITIVDVADFGYSNFDMKLTKRLLQMVLQYYPERQNKVFIINMSAFVMGFYKLIKPFLPTRTNDKLIFHGKNREEISLSLMEHLGFSIY